ncbi:hypothetical protein ACVWXO_004782 [Bradyrhizobium sp. LM2.7]
MGIARGVRHADAPPRPSRENAVINLSQHLLHDPRARASVAR